MLNSWLESCTVSLILWFNPYTEFSAVILPLVFWSRCYMSLKRFCIVVSSWFKNWILYSHTPWVAVSLGYDPLNQAADIICVKNNSVEVSQHCLQFQFILDTTVAQMLSIGVSICSLGTTYYSLFIVHNCTRCQIYYSGIRYRYSVIRSYSWLVPL